MPTGRIILKSISESKKLASLSSDSARLLYTWLIPHVDVNGCFSGDPDVIRGQVFTRLGKDTGEIESLLADLEKVGLIVRYFANGDSFIFLPTFEEKQPHLNKNREAKTRIPLPTPDQLKTYSGLTRKKVLLKFKSKLKVKDNVEHDNLVAKVLTYFNEVTGQNRKADTEGFISGRISEGRTFENFKHVIDTKYAQWWDDPKMCAFIRPSTLFRPSNFEDYLNEPYQAPPKKKSPDGRPPKTPEQSAKDKERQAKIDAHIKSIYAELEPKINAARKEGNVKLYEELVDRANDDVRIFSGKVMRGEV